MTAGPTRLPEGLPRFLNVADESDVGSVRRFAVTVASAQGFDADGRARVGLVATELASNLAKHAVSGRVLVSLVSHGDTGGVELLSIDAGPGIDDPDRCMPDGYSSTETLGGGLGAIARLSDLFDIYSRPGRGTLVMSRLWSAPPAWSLERPCRVGAVAESYPGELVSGDAWAVEQQGGRATAMLVDGLGHGIEAEGAAIRAVDAFRPHSQEPVEDIVGHIHAALPGTRGAAVAVASVEPDAGLVRFCGVGNISARVIDGATSVSLASHWGIVGHQVRKTQAFTAAWRNGSLLVLHSDGFSGDWGFDEDLSLDQHHPLLAAGVIVRDAKRREDDATVLVLGRNHESEESPPWAAWR